MDAWILGSGVQSLAAAVYLIEEAKVPPNRVHILETIGKAGESTANVGDPVNGYEYRGGAVPSVVSGLRIFFVRFLHRLGQGRRLSMIFWSFMKWDPLTGHRIHGF